jgi:outer membrane protein W
MKKIIPILISTSLLLFAQNVFSAGEKHLGFTLGSSNNFGNNYTVVGAKVNYFVIDNLSVGAEYKGFLGEAPSINQVTVPVTYHLPLENTTYKPYFGAFFNRTFIENSLMDYNIYGGRAGVSLQISPHSFFSIGWVQEFSNTGNEIENDGYPEITGGFSF